MVPRARYPFVIALTLGLTYALVTRFVAAAHVSGLDIVKGGLLSTAFLVVMPVALGAITAHFTPADAASTGKRLVWAPLLTVLLFLLAALLFKLEGMIRVLIISPLFLLMSCLGAFLYAGIADHIRAQRNKTPVLAAFVLLPYLVGPAERLFATPDSYRLVENHIDIAAPAPVCGSALSGWRPSSAVPWGTARLTP